MDQERAAADVVRALQAHGWLPTDADPLRMMPDRNRLWRGSEPIGEVVSVDHDETGLVVDCGLTAPAAERALRAARTFHNLTLGRDDHDVLEIPAADLDRRTPDRVVAWVDIHQRELRTEHPGVEGFLALLGSEPDGFPDERVDHIARVALGVAEDPTITVPDTFEPVDRSRSGDDEKLTGMLSRAVDGLKSEIPSATSVVGALLRGRRPRPRNAGTWERVAQHVLDDLRVPEDSELNELLSVPGEWKRNVGGADAEVARVLFDRGEKVGDRHSVLAVTVRTDGDRGGLWAGDERLTDQTLGMGDGTVTVAEIALLLGDELRVNVRVVA